MTIRVALEHRTSYRFGEPVQIYPHTIRLRPAPHSRTPIPSYALRIEPAEHFVNWQQDPFGNWLARVVFPDKVDHLEITVDLLADMTVINPFDFFVEDWAATFPFAYPEQLRDDLAPYLHPVGAGEQGEGGRGDTATSPDVVAWLEERMPSLLTAPRDAAVGDGTPIVSFVVALNRAIRESVDYTVRLEPGVQSPSQTLDRGIGSCRDSAWLLVAALRHLGLAARFVSGYLVQLSTDQAAVDGPDGPAEDFTDLHAWAEVYIPGAGWVGLDATSGLLCGEGHIPLSCTPHPSSAAPISGATAPVSVDFDFANTVTRVAEDPRVTQPVDDGQWARINEIGEAVDTLLAKGDVRLTMGGEPTFVAAGGTRDPQWHTAADGEQKRALAMALARRLSGPGTLRHHGQGKWYPGEPLPRWQIMLADRADGRPLWSDPDLLDDPWGEDRLESGSPEAAGAARDLAVGVARRLGVDVEHLAAAVEDPLQRLVLESRRPVGQEPTDGDLAPDDPEGADEESRAARVAEVDEAADPDTPAAWVLPLFPAPDGEGWATTTWRTRRGFLALVPGDSPAGLRLPLGSIAWSEGPVTPERSPFAPRGALPTLDPTSLATVSAPAAQVIPIETAPRTALAVEHRDGHLFVFLPPLEDLEDAIGLIAAVEGAASEVGQPVVLEGYAPPGDERVRTMSVTPDPGVIEVNVSPTASWSELVEQTESVHENARQIHLATEKFDVDGSHTGTGGGNHITLGGHAPKDSPLLRRPDLLRSLVTYWQHHPALSYLFSGRFIGPTSQAPRVDEGRPDALYELEIAFAQMDHVLAMEHDDEDITEPLTGRNFVKQHTRPWLVDRLLRHLLTDITGNTHRAEFCIDKLFAPGSERGRLGLLELRGFEMPPHPRMALLQALLVRSLVAKFWEEPYTAPLVHWGTRLHDRYLLPAFVAADLRDVLEDVNRYLASVGAGRLDPAWFDSFLEFRFPRLGDTVIGGVELELRTAIEPWHVLGEEVRQSGTARFVDSSVEKVQVRAVGLVEGRHVVTCNGVPVPMVPVAEQGWGGPVGAKGATGVFVGGVRFRAWAPPSALHPTIGVHGPLVFDLVDRWAGRSLGGFTHHVTHPGGISYDSFPVNAASAESRRAARFVVGGHTPGPVDVDALPDPVSSLGPAVTDFPVTLDLRRFPGTDQFPGTVDDHATPADDAGGSGMPPPEGTDVVETSAEGPVS